MKSIKRLINLCNSRNIVFLVSVSITLFFALVSFIVVNYGIHLADLNRVIAENELQSQKMQLNSELMEIARARVRVTLQIVDTHDVFEQDELNMDLDRMASLFADIRSKLLNMDQTAEEQAIYKIHEKIVPKILPAQRRAVELAMSGDPDALVEARKLVYNIVVPGQGQMIDSFRKIVSLEQGYISNLRKASHKSVSQMQNRNNLVVTLGLTVVLSLSVIVIIRITQIQKELLYSHKELEKRVEERTHEMVTAKEEAEYANRAKSEFLAKISHEIRTPMNAIINLSYLALSKKMESEAREYIKKLKFSGENLLIIVNEILDFSKIEAGKLQIENIEFRLKDQISELIDTQKLLAQEKRLELNYVFTNCEHDFLVGDPLRLRQIITNLISNAIKFTPQGEIKLIIDEIESVDGRAIFEMSVIDSGIGISKEQLRHLFEPFKQADDSTTRKYGGSGLGLAICKQLADIMGGSISVSSSPGNGSTFIVNLPFVIAKPTVNLNHNIKHDSNKTADQLVRLKNTSILLVEDNEVNQIIAQGILEQFGIEVTIANNGIEALDLINQHGFDLVLMDVHMPEMDGYEATRQIRKNSKWKHLPIIAMTANAMKDNETQSLDAGMNAHLSKPINVDELGKNLVFWIFKNQDESNLEDNDHGKLTNQHAEVQVE